LVSGIFELNARKRRSYNREKTRNMAMETIEQSDELSHLVNYGGGEYPLDSVSVEYLEGEDINELELEDDIIFDMDQLTDIYIAFVEGYDENEYLTASGISKKELMDNIMDWLGTPYRFGGMSRRAIDCSAFVLTMFKNAGDIVLPRTARRQFASVGIKIDREHLEFGDLIFFHTRRYAYASHVGIYLGDNLFAHASSKYGVTISSLESHYYSKRFIGGRRITDKDLARLSPND
jgi:probable lipoprotein NlpC